MSGDGGGRLPSFKGPRDLSLLTSAALTLSLTTPGQPSSSTSSRMQPSSSNQPPIVVRPKRIFKPNIPPKRDTSIASASSSSTDPPTSSSPADKSSKPGRGHDRGGRGGRGGRGRGSNYIQSSSVFEQGVGDPTSSGRSTRSRRSGGGGGDGGSRGGGRSRGRGRGPSRVASAMTREKLEDIIKTENTKVEPLDNMEDFMSGGAIEEDDDLETFEDEDEAVVLPLTSYLPKLLISKKTPKFQPGGQKGKQHIFYKSDNRGLDFLSVTGKSRKKPVLCLFQLPSHLPVLLEQEQRQLATSLETLPEALFLQFLKSFT
ncbi:uncharacterized protein LOC110843585 isoform X3 [Folsomia candida]|uniref:uncharacterized protein LOC110843585 isoform X3 n=1 Tax=Folsomia candida TaxID=158441 RepID=UPI001604C572|nr:uncharacterized protein LOC110843585 isoform X3 [Folsomia candida]